MMKIRTTLNPSVDGPIGFVAGADRATVSAPAILLTVGQRCPFALTTGAAGATAGSITQ